METRDLSGCKGLVVGIAKPQGLAFPAARHFRKAGAELATTCYNDKTKLFLALLA